MQLTDSFLDYCAEQYFNSTTTISREVALRKELEKHIETKIKSYLDSLEAYYIKTHGSVYSRAGTPDILACVNGKFVAIEVKRPGGVVSELQKANIELIKRAGGVAFIAYSVKDVERNLQKEHLI